MSEQTNNSPVFLITGCSTGLGREIAIAAIASGFRVIATARRAETLADLEARGAKAIALDVTSSVEDLAAFAVKAIAVYGQVDFLVNNAGFGQGGAIEEVSPIEALAQFNTNFFGLVNTTNVFLPHFRSRKAGTIVNISSEITYNPNPGAGMYCASKAAVNAVSDTWAHELAEYGIRSISVQPGAFRTEFFKQSALPPPVAKIEGYTVAHATMDFMSNEEFQRAIPGDPAKAARNIVKVVTGPEVPLRFVVELEVTRELSTGTNFDR
ncbi:Short-chain oxidoreductase [Mycena venus]|uniref:Short-chain oxidoreductase n=1 Tax=Mycena venus TaxID=2733690 RepID=A0A8H6XPW6_9AGAR|nr:Short-chain oxidoreductase [Mycena venus]